MHLFFTEFRKAALGSTRDLHLRSTWTIDDSLLRIVERLAVTPLFPEFLHSWAEHVPGREGVRGGPGREGGWPGAELSGPEVQGGARTPPRSRRPDV